MIVVLLFVEQGREEVTGVKGMGKDESGIVHMRIVWLTVMTFFVSFPKSAICRLTSGPKFKKKTKTKSSLSVFGDSHV